jgi:hypothetical protein
MRSRNSVGRLKNGKGFLFLILADLMLLVETMVGMCSGVLSWRCSVTDVLVSGLRLMGDELVFINREVVAALLSRLAKEHEIQVLKFDYTKAETQVSEIWLLRPQHKLWGLGTCVT